MIQGRKGHREDGPSRGRPGIAAVTGDHARSAPGGRKRQYKANDVPSASRRGCRLRASDPPVCFRSACVTALCILLCLAAPALAGEDGAEVVGPLDEGKTYRQVNGHPITGKQIANLMVGQRWEKERGAFAEHILVQEAMDRKGINVTDQEIKDELKRMATVIARKNGFNPSLFKPEALARHLKYSLEFLHAQYRTALGLRKMLIRAGKLKESMTLENDLTREAMQKALKKMAEERGVVFNVNQLGENEAIRIGGRGYSREQVRKFILDGIGPMIRADLANALEMLTLELLLSQALAEHGRKEVTEEDRTFHFSYLARLREYTEGDPDGRRSILFNLQQKGMTIQSFLQERSITFDAGITFLAREAIREQDLKAEWEREPKTYQRKEKMLAHIFVCVRDPDGRAYTPAWEARGHRMVNDHVRKVRDERFAEAKPRIVRMIGAAKADFAAAAARLSEDEGTKKSGGLIGRVGPKSVLPTLPIDQAFIKEALKLKPGEVSEPIRSAYGWHLVKCLEKDQQATVYSEEGQYEKKSTREHIFVVLLKRKRKDIHDSLMKSAKVEDKY